MLTLCALRVARPLSHLRLLPSNASKLSAFSALFLADYPNDHDYTFFGAQYSPYIIDSLSFVLPLPVLHVSFTAVLPAKLCTGGNYTSQPVETGAPTG
jgi:hypothetical protein